MIRKKVLTILLLLTVLLGVGNSVSGQSGVLDGETLQTNPKDRPVTVSLTISDEEPPSTPILISPTNNSIITDSTPSFVWEESTDNFAMDYYVLYVDGVIKFTNIPLTDTTNGDYTLTKSGDEYTLTPSASLTDGSHTWKIQAVDVHDNSKDSATWSFTIDTTAPTLVITEIGEETTAISAQDLSTLPDPYLTIYVNEPLLQGTSEANSSIQLTVVIPNESDLNYTITVDSSGNWSQQLPILDRDVIITLNFIVTDTAGNVTVLNDVYFLIGQEFLFSTTAPTPSVAATGIPGVDPTATPGPTADLPNSGFGIPLVPPKEIIYNILDVLVPEQVLDSIPDFIKDLSSQSAPYASVLLSGAIPLTLTALFASQFGWALSAQILVRILQALGLLPPPAPQGMVFNSETEEPVAFAILNISQIDNLSTSETVVTNTDGVYGGVSLPPGKYVIQVRHQDFSFPTIKKRPTYLSMYEFYKGETFEITKEKTKQLFLIPVDPLKNTAEKIQKFVWTSVKERLVRLLSHLFIPLFIFSTIVTLFYPSVLNMIVTAIYVVLFIYKAFKWFKIPTIRGKIVNHSNQPLENVFVRIFSQESNQLMAVTVTDSNGEFKSYLPKGIYEVSLNKQGYIWTENNQVLNFYEADVRQKRAVILGVMQDANVIYRDLFSEGI